MRKTLGFTAFCAALVFPTVALSGPPLTPDEYEKLIVAMSGCEARESPTTYYGWVDSACPAYKALMARRAEKDATIRLGDTGPIARKLLGHASPAVRLYAAQMMESVLGTNPDNLKALAQTARTEKDVAVLKAILHASWNAGARQPEIAAMLLELAGHANPSIRATAAVGLSSPWNKTMKGGVGKLKELMEKDKDMAVRKAACSSAGDLGDDALIPMYEKLTDPAADKDLAAACMAGVMKMWASYPLWENRSEKAYRLTLKRLEQRPRSDKFPPWTIMSTFQNVGEGAGSSFDKWKAGATWFNAAATRKVLAGVIADKDANWMGRTALVKASLSLGATRADLEELKKGLKLEGPDKYVLEELEEAILKAR